MQCVQNRNKKFIGLRDKTFVVIAIVNAIFWYNYDEYYTTFNQKIAFRIEKIKNKNESPLGMLTFISYSVFGFLASGSSALKIAFG